MARAKVELKGAATHTRNNGKRMIKHRPEILTNAGDIAYYRAQAGFVVTDLEQEAAPPQPKAKPAKVAATAPDKKKGTPPKTKASTDDGEEAPL